MRMRYSLEDVYGVSERPPENCPTYIDRKAHKGFQYTVHHERQHIVVYGASRQGKTWLIEKYCPDFVRIGCDAKFTRELLFKAILHALGVTVGDVQNVSSVEHQADIGATGKAGASVPFIGKIEGDVKGKLTSKHSRQGQITYKNIDLTNQAEVIAAIKANLHDRFIVIENFHFLDPTVQKAFASSLKEFLYHDIRVIIVGVWKETTKLVSLASDLTNRIEPIDIGDWSSEELRSIVRKGDEALNTVTPEEMINEFINNSGHNVGMFKSLLRNFCKLCGVYETQPETTELNDWSKVEEAKEKSYQEVIVPALDRLQKLASSKKSGGKGLRYYVVRALLDIMASSPVEELLKGIPITRVVEMIQSYKEENFQSSNIKQELFVLHQRDETVASEGNSTANFIPLFYCDQGKDRVFIVESALLAACRSGRVDLSSILGPKELYVK